VVGNSVEARKGNNIQLIEDKLPVNRERIPSSLTNLLVQKSTNAQQQKSTSSACNEQSLCASFETNTTPASVSSWMGFYYEQNKETFFIATYGQEATHLGDNVYSTPKWDKGHFWINVGEKSVPLPIQPRYVGVDKASGYEWHVVDYLGYQRADTNYTNYWNNMSVSSLTLLVNPQTKKVEQYQLDYYNENDEFAGSYEINVGDKIQSFFLGFKEGKDDVDHLFSTEYLTTVTAPISFEYKEQYPGKDFACTRCGDLDIASKEFKYMFEEFSKERSTFTKPLSAETNSTNTASSSKSVSISGFWMFFMFSIFIAMVVLNNEHKLRKS